MKKLLVCAMLLLSTQSIMAQSDKYTQAMLSQIIAFEAASSPDEMLRVSNSFERIAEAEKTQWLPYYYAALGHIFYAFMKNDATQFDAHADAAEQLFAKATALEPQHSELEMMKAMLATLRMLVDPMNRWMKYNSIITAALENAKKLDPSNPRPYMWQAQQLRGTPEQFGGGCAVAKSLFETALAKYETFQPASVLHPTWGKKQAKQQWQQCK